MEDYQEVYQQPAYQSTPQIPPQYKPLGAWAYFGYSILFAIPLVGLICAIVFSFNNDNINRRNFARSYFCGLAISVALIILAAIAGFSLADSFANMM